MANGDYMHCNNLNTENSLMKFLGGDRGGVTSHFCLLKKQGILEAMKITETLKNMNIETMTIINEFCPFATSSREDFEKCPWFNKSSIK
jgi:predicted restriction endonuclease